MEFKRRQMRLSDCTPTDSKRAACYIQEEIVDSVTNIGIKLRIDRNRVKRSSIRKMASKLEVSSFKARS